MRILHTANTYAPLLDGVSEVVRHISEELASRGHEVHVATRAVPSQPEELVLNGVRVHRFSVRGNLASGMRGEIREYREFVRSGRWDILVNHCLQVWSTDALLEEVASFPWASVLVTHGLSAENPIFAEYYRRIPEVILRYAGWVTVSGLNEELAYAKRYQIPEPTVIRNGVDLHEWSAAPLGVRRRWNREGHPWLVSVSNHSHQKNHGWLFQLAERMRKTGTKLTILGNSLLTDKWRLGRIGIRGGCFYECCGRALLSGGSVELTTSVPRSEVVSAIQEADVLVSTSHWEANSVVLLESMAAGTPWVSTDVGSARENAGGIVVNSVNEMADTVSKLLQNSQRRQTLGGEGRARALESHDWKRITDRYEELYEDAIGLRRSSGNEAVLTGLRI